MSKQSHVDTIISQLPSHIIQDYPRFYEFLEAYYEWMMQEGNPYERIRHHMDYMTFEKSLDSYVDFMKYEYLNDVPDSVLLDKELFIKWSRSFNSSRGSHASLKFLFKILFGEQTTSVYLPKENILKTSDGVWVSGESLMLLTHNADNLEQFQFQKIIQTRPIYEDIVETATASVQRVRTRYVGRYVVTELSISNIEGEFKEGFPVKTDAGAEEWLIPILNDTVITDSGSGHQIGQRVFIDGMTQNEVERIAEVSGQFDTRITSFFNDVDINVFINNVEIFDYTYDGRIVTSTNINEGDTITVTMPSYQGYLVVDEVDQDQGITQIEILDLPLGRNAQYTLSTDTVGSTFQAYSTFGLVKPVAGYYSGTKGQLSSNMYLQDSYFYQNYSYAIRTQQDYSLYADIVKQTLHPAGFVMFGQLSFLSLIDIIIKYQEDPELPNHIQTILHKYGLGVNYNFVNRFKDKASIRLYKQSDFDLLDQSYLNGEPGYDLESAFLANRINSYDYDSLKGWMNKFNWADYYLFVPQDYSDENESGNLYFETGYVSTRISEEIVVNDDTIILS